MNTKTGHTGTDFAKFNYRFIVKQPCFLCIAISPGRNPNFVFVTVLFVVLVFGLVRILLHIVVHQELTLKFVEKREEEREEAARMQLVLDWTQVRGGAKRVNLVNFFWLVDSISIKFRAFLWVLIEDLGPHEDLFCEIVLIGAPSPHLQFVQLARHDYEESV